MEKFKFLKSVLLGTLIVVCFCGCGKDTAEYISIESTSELEPETEIVLKEELTEQIEENENTEIYVYVCGEIVNPGVYTLTEGSRVCDVFALAAGFTEEAATDYWNQARVLKDGEMIYVPTKEEAKERMWTGEETEGIDDNATGKININTASKTQLMEIPGIGEAKANAIISYREENGAFSSIEDVKKVEGIKDAVFEKMKEYIVIN